MNRLWLTDQQTKSLIRALRNYIHQLNKCVKEAIDDGNSVAAEGYNNEANILDTILDTLEACYGD